MTDTLFPLPAPAGPVAAPDPLSPDRRRTRRQRALLADGVHPATGRKLLPGSGLRCRDCVHVVKLSTGNRAWWKCDRHRLGLSHSAASDIRVSWPACELFATAPVTS